MKKSDDNVRYHLDNHGCFVIENYNHSKPFSSFFPGIAGLWGIPMWVFYVNRGQCISSFGIEGKDKAILEFQPANKAYRFTSTNGFRTFLKVKTGQRTHTWEPFQVWTGHQFKTQQKMYITAHDLTIEDINPALGLAVRVNYFTLPEEPFPALVRRISIENISKKTLEIEMIDGLPAIVAFGIKDWLNKNLARTVEAWVKVGNLKHKAPFYHLTVEVSDTPDVTFIEDGNFYFAFDAGKKTSSLLDIVVEGSAVFGQVTDFSYPHKFFTTDAYKIPTQQQTSNRTPSALSYCRFFLSSNKHKEITALAGYTHNERELRRLTKRTAAKGYIQKKMWENRDIIQGIKHFAMTNTSSPTFNLYCPQMFLDNVMRGGLPVSLKTEEGNVAFNVFSRKHGDLERDYNYFLLSATPFSQGNGNYRDVNQNRRNDIWFNTDVKDNVIIDFLSLIQADGYNPLVVKGLSFFIDDPKKIPEILKECVKDSSAVIADTLARGFQPGELLRMIDQHRIELKVSPQTFLAKVLSCARKQQLAEHHEGFWTDHWTYNLDLIESYLTLYPEALRALLLEKKEFYFYHNPNYVLPRENRYLLTGKNVVRQYRSVKDGSKEISIKHHDHKLRCKKGEGDVYYTTRLNNLLCLAANTVATLDPSGIGIEMEADKPNWYDALNGLPGLLGSSLSETFELKRLCLFLKNAVHLLQFQGQQIQIFDELTVFIKELKGTLDFEEDALAYWHKTNVAKERYRSHIRTGIAGNEQSVSILDIDTFLSLVIEKLDKGISAAKDNNGLFPTYFYHEVTEFELHGKETPAGAHVRPIAFKRHALPYFLEGFVHALRIEKDSLKTHQLYQGVRSSPLFDKKLKMFKVNADISKESPEIGRTHIFPKGWLENESIWLHMEYKFLLELLRSGLYEEFYACLKESLIPFLDPQIYGRSTLENSSFIASSAHEDTSLHGQGFVARLSGSTAEFIHMWLLMNLGPSPFIINKEDRRVCLALKPILPGWLFTTEETSVLWPDRNQSWQTVILPKNTYAFNFLGTILVVYHNPGRKDTFGNNQAQITEIRLVCGNTRKPVIITGSTIPAQYTADIRNRKVRRIDVFLQ